jgi:hypothetical protein
MQKALPQTLDTESEVVLKCFLVSYFPRRRQFLPGKRSTYYLPAGSFVDTPATRPKVAPPPPGPPGMCGNHGEACCADQICNEGMACNAYDIYEDNRDDYPTWFTCQECGGYDLDDSDPPSRIAQLACTGKHCTLRRILTLTLRTDKKENKMLSPLH